MRKLLAVASVLMVALAGVAVAQDADDTMTVKSSAAAGGSKTKPKPIAPSFDVLISGPGGVRAKTPLEHDWSWTGVREMGQYFPTCLADDIDAAQSDEGCDPKSLVAEGTIVANLGPEGVYTQNIRCDKGIRYYNEGKGKVNLYAFGPADKCAGVGYLPPIKIDWKKVGTSSVQKFIFPDNIAHPLPGIEGGFTEVHLKFNKLTTKVKLKGFDKKVKVGYLTSFGCKGKRKFTFAATPAVGAPNTQTVDAGNC